MKALRGILDNLHPLFVKGGKLEKLYPLYEAGDTFLFTPGEVTKGASHLRDGIDLKRMMSIVVVALVPCVLMALYNTGLQANLGLQSMGLSETSGWRAATMATMGIGYDPNNVVACMIHGLLYFLPIYIVTMTVGGLWEAFFATVRKHEINEGFLVTGLLFPLTLPATIPLWQVALGISFGVIFGKEVFGGTGKNFLNPALTARAFLFSAYPAEISGDAVWTAVDGFSGATPLGAMAAQGMAGVNYSWDQAFLGTIQGSMGETSTLACLLGAVILIGSGIGSWRIMLGMLLGGLALSSLLYSIGSTTNPMFEVSPMWHLVVGGFAFGMVFMATDPVSAAMTNKGKYIYGFLVGLLSIVVRSLNPAFAEGVMLSILFGNTFAPLIDYYVVKSNIKRRLLRTALKGA